MSDCERIERAIGRELTASEMCGVGMLILDGHTEAQIVADLKARDALAGNEVRA